MILEAVEASEQREECSWERKRPETVLGYPSLPSDCRGDPAPRTAAPGCSFQKETPAPSHILLFLFFKGYFISHTLACQGSWHWWLIVKFSDPKLLPLRELERGCWFFAFFFNQKDPSPLLLHLNSVFLFPWKPGRPDSVRGRPVSEESKDLGAAVAAPCSAFPSVWPEDLESESSAETSCRTCVI